MKQRKERFCLICQVQITEENTSQVGGTKSNSRNLRSYCKKCCCKIADRHKLVRTKWQRILGPMPHE